MRVILRNQLFTGDRLFERGDHKDFPDELKHLLPKSAQTKFEGDEPAPVAAADYRDLDVTRAAGDELTKTEDDAEARRLANRAKIAARLAAETKPK